MADEQSTTGRSSPDGGQKSRRWGSMLRGVMAGVRSGVARFMAKPGRKAMVVGGALLFTGVVVAGTGGGLLPGLMVAATGAAATYAGYRSYKADRAAAQQGGRAGQGFPSQPYPGMEPGQQWQQPYAPQAGPPFMEQNWQGKSLGASVAEKQQNQDELLARQIAAEELRNSAGVGYVPAPNDWQLAQFVEEAAISQRRQFPGSGNSLAANGGEATSQDTPSARWKRTAEWVQADGAASSSVLEDERDEHGDLRAESYFPETVSSRDHSFFSAVSRTEPDEDHGIEQGLYSPLNARESPGNQPTEHPRQYEGSSRAGSVVYDDRELHDPPQSPYPYGPGLPDSVLGSEFSPRQSPISPGGGEITRAISEHSASLLPSGGVAGRFLPDEPRTSIPLSSDAPTAPRPSTPVVRPSIPPPGKSGRSR